MEAQKSVISTWKKKPLQMVVYKTPVGKNSKGEVIYSSKTVHEKISK